jgi:hypothetical protein
LGRIIGFLEYCPYIRLFRQQDAIALSSGQNLLLPGVKRSTQESIITEIHPKEYMLKKTLYIIGGFLILSGGVWFLQGINILPGSYMSGDPQWATNGTIAIVIGIGLILFGRRKK